MNTPSYIEDHSSQIPALIQLSKLEFDYLTLEEVEVLRWSPSNVLLKPILEQKIREVNLKGINNLYAGMRRNLCGN